MQDLINWFQTRDYGVGISLLGKYSRNRYMYSVLSKRVKPEKLEYELHKIAVGFGLNPVQPLLSSETQLRDEPVQEPAVPSPGPEEISGMNRKLPVATVDELPLHLKTRWEQNRDSYKEIRSLHEKLKLMEKASDNDRMPLTMRIAHLDDVIRANWKEIDAWVPAEKEPEHIFSHKRINANRKYISKNLQALDKGITDKEKFFSVKSEIQLRLSELSSAGEVISGKTKALLQKYDISC